MKKFETLLLFILLTISLSLRLYKVDRPIADWHSWRQADTAAVSRNFIKDGFNLFVPKYDDMSTQANGLDNPDRLRFVEFPIYNAIIAVVWLFTGVNETAARLTTVTITVFSNLFLYFIVRHFSGRKVALFSALFFAINPYNVFYSSTILPGPFMVFSLLGFYLMLINFLKRENLIFLILSIVFSSIAILSWPIALFFMLPPAYLIFEKYKLAVFKKVKLWVLAILSISPFIAWRLYIQSYPEGIPNYFFLLNEGNIRFKGAFFRWLIEERLGTLILTLSGFTLFLLGIVTKPAKEKLFYLTWLLSVGLYFSVFASGNVRHDYYQVPIIPALCIFMALGARTLLEKSEIFSFFLAKAVVLFSIIFMVVFGYYQVKGYYWINRPEIVEAGRKVDELLPKDALVIAPYNGDAAFLYQTNRRGYPIVDRPLTEFVAGGVKYFVTVDLGDNGIKSLVNNCKVIEKSEKFAILELSKECLES